MRKSLTVWLLAAAIYPVTVQAVPVSVQFDIPGSLSIVGHTPVPQVNGFDYAITAEQIEAGLAAQTFNLRRLTLTADAQSLGTRVNFDVEIHLSGSAIGLPAGQYVNTLVDPVAGYARGAASQLRVVIGDFPFTGDFDLGLGYDAASNSVAAAPSLNIVKQLPQTALSLSNGLHAQVFLWTADNRNANIVFSNLRLVVEGDASIGLPAQVPEPSALLLLGIGLAAIRFTRHRDRA
jgi:regulator of protease activity HflC (stomatin/prohibitin superfamily)